MLPCRIVVAARAIAASGRTGRCRRNPARYDPPMHRIAVLALDQVVAFDLSIPAQVFGHPDERDRYALTRLRRRAGPGARRSTGFAIVAAHGPGRGPRRPTRSSSRASRRPPPRARAAVARRAARGRRPRRADDLDLHRRLRARGGGAARRAPRDHALAPRRRAAGRATRRSRSTPASSTSTRGASSRRPAWPPASTSACTSCARDHGAAAANAIARRMVVAPHRGGGQAQFVERALPAADRRRPGGHARVDARAPRRAAHRRRRWPATPRAASARSPATSAPRRARRRCAGCTSSACCTPAGCWRRATCRSRTSRRAAGFGTATTLREHFGRSRPHHAHRLPASVQRRRAVTSISNRIRGSVRPHSCIVAAGRTSPKWRRRAGQHASKSPARGSR